MEMPPSRNHLPGLLAALVLASATHAADDSVWVRFPNGVEKRGVLVSRSALSLRIAETQWERMREVFLTIRYERVAALRINGTAVDTPVTLAAVERALLGPAASDSADSDTSSAHPVGEDSAGQAPAPEECATPPAPRDSGAVAPRAPTGSTPEQPSPALPPAPAPSPEAPPPPRAPLPPPAADSTPSD